MIGGRCDNTTMDFKQLFDDDRAVSPVIGVILMVAITVILAAVIGTFVLGLGDQLQGTQPQVSFGFDTTVDSASGNVTAVSMSHQSGESLDVSSVSVRTTSEVGNATDTTTENLSNSWSWTEVSGDENTLSAGSSGTVYAPTDGDLRGTTIRVVYNAPGSDSSTTLGEFAVPE